MTETSDNSVLTREVHDPEDDPIDGLVKWWSPRGSEPVKRESWSWKARRHWDSTIWRNWEVSQRPCDEEAGAAVTCEPFSQGRDLPSGPDSIRNWYRDEASHQRAQSRRTSLELVSTALLIFGLAYFVFADSRSLGADPGGQPLRMFITGLTAGVLLATLRLKILAFEQVRDSWDVEAESRLDRLCSYLPQSAALVRSRGRVEVPTRGTLSGQCQPMR